MATKKCVGDDVYIRRGDLRLAATKLIERMDAVHNDPAYVAVWQISQMHVGAYRGPKYDKELRRLRKVLRLK